MKLRIHVCQNFADDKALPIGDTYVPHTTYLACLSIRVQYIFISVSVVVYSRKAFSCCNAHMEWIVCPCTYVNVNPVNYKNQKDLIVIFPVCYQNGFPRLFCYFNATRMWYICVISVLQRLREYLIHDAQKSESDLIIW